MNETGFNTFSADYVTALTDNSGQALGIVAAAVAAGATSSEKKDIHITESGDILSTSAQAFGNDGHIVLRGSIGPFPYEMHLTVKMDGSTITVTLDIEKPINLPPYVWSFDLQGIMSNAAGDIVSATGVKPSLTMPAMGLDWWCVARCGGLAILTILVTCLPALAGGPAAYIACVTGRAGEGAAGIAVCIAEKCA